jgi:phage terminase small subunit
MRLAGNFRKGNRPICKCESPGPLLTPMKNQPCNKRNDKLELYKFNLLWYIFNMAITGKVLIFCEAVAKGANYTDAALKAGCSEKSAKTQGSKWMDRKDVKEWLADVSKSAAERVGLDREWVLRKSKEIVVKCTEPVQVFDKKGKPVTEPDPDNPDGPKLKVYMLYDAKSANKALETIAKHLKMLTDKVEVQTPDADKFRPEPTTAEEAARRYQEFMRRSN